MMKIHNGQLVEVTQEEKDEILQTKRLIQESLATAVPTYITILQLRKVLRDKGYINTVKAAIQTFTEEEQDEWEYSSVIFRNSTIVVRIKEILKLTEDQVDNIFRLASKL